MRLALTLAALSLALPAGAGASIATLEQTDRYAASVVYSAGDGEANEVQVQRAGDDVVLTDAGADIDGRGGCAPSGPHAVTCSSSLEISDLIADLGDGDDSASGGGLVMYAKGGSGHDVLDARGSVYASLAGEGDDDFLIGGRFGDDLDGGPGPDRLEGGGGGDDLLGGPGTDTLDGGPGIDGALYGDHRAPVVVDLSRPGSPAGAAGENDSVTRVESVGGGRAADHLIAAPAGSRLFGGSGADSLEGGPGPDEIEGAAGDDEIYGRGERDDLAGGAGRDLIRAGRGDDRIDSGDDSDSSYQRDSVHCGPGDDSTGPAPPGLRTAPFLDLVADDCEQVTLPSNAVPRMVNRTAHPTRALRFGLTCVAPQRCRVRIRLRAHGRLAGSAEREVRDQQAYEYRHESRLTVPLSDEARDELERTGVLRLRLSMTIRFGRHLNNRHSTGYHLLLREPAPAR